MKITSRIARAVAPRAGSLAPGSSSAVIHRALDRAIRGVGPLPGAAASAESHLAPEGLEALQAGKPVPRAQLDRAVKALVAAHVRLAATQGFVTNVGGLAAMTATVPANLAGLALVQTHMIAGIAHLGGHDLADPFVRDAILVGLLGPDGVDALVESGKLPGGPRTLLAERTDDAQVAELDRLVAGEITRDLVARVSGRRLATVVGRRVPVLGGAVGAGSDARGTKALGDYAAREFAA